VCTSTARALRRQLTPDRSRLEVLRANLSSIRASLVSTLADIFPIELYSPPDLLFTILDLPLPIPLLPTDPAPPLSLPDHQQVNEDSVAAALGFVAEVLQLLSAYLGTSLTYPVTCVGSRSLIRDGISSMVGPRT
jgi:UV radiation resistance-associated gene protein